MSEVPTNDKTPDWNRLQRALMVEAERGFNDLEGHQQRFSEFLHGELSSPPEPLTEDKRGVWRSLAADYSRYGEMSFAARQYLVAETRKTIYETQKSLERATTVANASTSGGRATPGSSSRQGSGAGKTKSGRSPASTPAAPPFSSKTPPLEQPVTYLKGVGPKNAERLAKLGIFTALDLLHYYPRDYINYAQQVAIRELQPGETVTLVGTVTRSTCFSSPKNPNLTIQELVLKDPTGQLRITKFWPGKRFRNVGWQQGQKRKYPTGAIVAASGLVKKNKYGITLDSPDLEVLDGPDGDPESLTVGRIVPVYPLTEGVGAALVRRAVASAMPAAIDLVDPLPEPIRQQFGLVPLPVAIAHIHFPKDDEGLQEARHRLVFDEFFYLQLGLLRRRQERRQEATSVILPPTGALIDQFYANLPFAFTGAQQRVVNEILTDIQQPTPMNRLVQGDVGSGKTVVAVVAILSAIQAGYQAALMAPTEVLAEQHYRKLVGWFNALNLPVELLTGSTRTAKRKQIHSELLTGNCRCWWAPMR
jgi:ATP-dependent DNA helicase RecG